MELKAFIDESFCIGCMKCIRICPTDAIVGAKQKLHTILPDLCTSCERCVNVCPTDCISLATEGEPMLPEREQQLTEKKQKRLGAFAFSVSVMQSNNLQALAQEKQPTSDRKQQIADAIARVKLKKGKF